MFTPLTRRDFFVQGALYGGSLWLFSQLPRPRAVQAAQLSSQPQTLTPNEWKQLEAMAARILPTDHEPGAREAGCVNFIDKALAHEDAALLPTYRKGLGGVEAVALKRFEKPFSALTPDQHDSVLVSLEAGNASGWPAEAGDARAFFETVRVHTIIGFLADPKYGGNRDYAGWKLVGYPGPQHHRGGYSPAQMVGKEKIRTAWGEEI